MKTVFICFSFLIFAEEYCKMKGNRLYKYEKLCSRTAINNIFQCGKSAICYPLRAAFSITEKEETPAQFLITIPKKKIRKAVNRVLLRRRVREAYRLNRNILIPYLQEKNISIKIAFIYLSDEISDYAFIESKMQALLTKVISNIEKSITKEENKATEQ